MNRISATLGLLSAALLVACATPRPALPPASGSTTSARAAAVPLPALVFFRRSKHRRRMCPRFSSRRAEFRSSGAKSGRRALVWVFRQPQADLLDAAGKPVGKHGANFSFEHDDGSRLVSTIAAYDEAPKPTDLRWLLLTTRSFGKGALESVAYVQRVNTSGGMPPPRCEASQLNQLLRVDFTSDFVFYRPLPE